MSFSFAINLEGVVETNGKRSGALMNVESELTWLEVKQIADQLAFQKTGKHLSDIETIVLDRKSVV